MSELYRRYDSVVNGRYCEVQERVGDVVDPYSGTLGIVATANIWLDCLDGTKQLLAFVSSSGTWFPGDKWSDSDEDLDCYCVEEQEDLHRILDILGVTVPQTKEDR